MQYLEIDKNTTLSILSGIVGERNVDSILNINGLARTIRVGQEFQQLVDNIKATAKEVDWQRKTTILNKLTKSSDVFEEAALLGEQEWKVFSNLDTFPNRLRIPETIKLPDSTAIIGNNNRIAAATYQAVMDQLKTPPHIVNSNIFGTYNAKPGGSGVTFNTASPSSIFRDFNIPWGDVCLYDSLSGDMIDIPGYPEELEDERTANYETMPELLFQYEPWQVYSSSGPRTTSYTWELHRQMWNGDERDGKANELIRFCQGCLYPDYKGSAVFTSTVTLYIKGYPLISGILTNVGVKWYGPIGLDGFYLAFTLTLSFVEISPQPLSHDVVRKLPVIG